jgi:FkbM family methyltransferase
LNDLIKGNRPLSYKNAFFVLLALFFVGLTYTLRSQKFDRWEFCRFGDYRLFEVDHIGYFCLERQSEDLIKKYLKFNKPWEIHILEALSSTLKKGDVIIDAGAYIGTHTIFASKLVGPQGEVHAFEPVGKTFKELEINTELNELSNVTLHKIALGKEDKIIEMNPVNKDNAGGTQIGVGGDKAQLKPLDSFSFRRLDLLKIDVEEFEDDLLEGAVKTIKSHNPFIIIEVQGAYLFERAPEKIKSKVLNTIKTLIDMNYKVFRIAGSDYFAVPKTKIPTLQQSTKAFIDKIVKLHSKKKESDKK